MALRAASSNARFLLNTHSQSHYRKQIALATLFQKHGFPSSLVPSLLSRNPSLLRTPLPDLRHSLSTLLFSLRLPQNAVVSLLTSSPSLLLDPTFLKTFQSHFPEIQSRFPKISPSTLVNLLLCSRKFDLNPLDLPRKLDLLKTRFAFSAATVAKVLEGFPDVLITSETEITNVVDFLVEFGIPGDEIDLVVGLFPRVLGIGVEDRLRPLVREIKELGFTNRELRREISRDPRILGMEIGEFSRMKCGVECVVDVPKYLGVSFEKHIVPRYSVVECLRGKGAIGFEVGLKDLVMPSRLRFYNLYVKPYPECEKIYGRLKGCGGEGKRKHPVGLWKLFKPEKFPESGEDVKNMRSFMESLV
uniref:Uncharacterized protein n=1 Tax=Glycine max TaxID=3847 RepID=A0A368UJU2_SOYBN